MTQAAVLASNASLMTTPSGTAPSYLCRAWVNFNGTGTVAIRASGNVTSITDNGTGNYTINLTTALSDTNYAILGTTDIALNASNNARVIQFIAIATTSLQIETTDYLGVRDDQAYINVGFFR